MSSHPCIRMADFDQSDFRLLRSVVVSRGDLFAGALACKIICERCSFPIRSASAILDAVFEGPGSYADFAGHIVTFEDAKTFLTPDLFPIEGEADLATRVLLAFERQNTVVSAREVIESFERLATGATEDQ
jgi:hypothetical protein